MSSSEPSSEIIDADVVVPPAKRPRFSKRLMIIAAAVILLLVVGGGGTLYLMTRSAAAPGEPVAEAHDGAEVTYIDAPAMVVNLRGADGAARFLKIRFTLVPVSESKGEEIKAKLPLIVDAFQPFLRELRPEDLAGSAAVFRIKEEMLVRATAALGPGKLKDILIQDLVQQ
ncbi:flagellar basal body-associated FliL family protein [Sphingomonas echinoides]|uniref:flagellar basal body-associated FliL family protein n=1 Tax=Sphingomonas echinoides TaxID=59803 RepID=UPI002413A9B2|nr:flagellar basal body-associated FliL family protein [Sphingomonas echinoides]